MTELRDTGRRRLAVLFGKRAAIERRDTEEREHVRRDPHCAHALGAVVGHVVHASGVSSKDRFERLRLLLIVEELRAREGSAEHARRRHVAQDDVHHPILVHVGKRIEQDVTDDAVDDGCRANAQRQRRDREEREAGIPAGHAKRLGDVLPQRIDARQAAAIAVAFLGLIETAEFHQRGAPALRHRTSRARRFSSMWSWRCASSSSSRVRSRARSAEGIDEAQQERAQPSHDAGSSGDRKRARIDVASSHCCVSRATCRRPARVRL